MLKTYAEQRTAAEKIEDARIKVRVLRGLKILHEEWGDDWVDHINPATLDLGSNSQCVLGQIYGDYDEAIGQIDRELEDEGGEQFGFDTTGRESYKELTEAWLTVLGETS